MPVSHRHHETKGVKVMSEEHREVKKLGLWARMWEKKDGWVNSQEKSARAHHHQRDRKEWMSETQAEAVKNDVDDASTQKKSIKLDLQLT